MLNQYELFFVSDEIAKKPDETFDEYKARLYELKYSEDLTWQDISNIIENQCNVYLSGNACRNQARRLRIKNNHKKSSVTNDSCKESLTPNDILFDIQKEKVKVRDERIQANALLRRISREETLKEIAADAVNVIKDSKPLNFPEFIEIDSQDKIGILHLSDWHYGLELDSYWNTYNPEIAKERIVNLRNKVSEKLFKNNVRDLYIINTGDMISGNIHLQLRLNSRIDVITQTMEVSELLAEFINDLSAFFSIKYADCLDNHSRIEPKKSDSLDLESLARITSWYLRERLRDNSNVTFFDNKISNDIITFNIFDFTVCAVHGHKDKPERVAEQMILMNKENYDLILTSHYHHFSADEKNETIILGNSSLMGTDDFAERLRVSSKPSQNLIISTQDNVVDSIFRILVD